MFRSLGISAVWLLAIYVSLPLGSLMQTTFSHSQIVSRKHAFEHIDDLCIRHYES